MVIKAFEVVLHGFLVILAKAMGTMDSEEHQQLPLLRRPSGGNEGVSGLSSVEVERILEHKPVPLRRYVRLIGWESRSLWLLSWASIIVSVCNYMLSFVSLTFSGQLGALELAGASLAMVGTQGLAYGIMVSILNLSTLFFWVNKSLYTCFLIESNCWIGRGIISCIIQSDLTNHK